MTISTVLSTRNGSVLNTRHHRKAKGDNRPSDMSKALIKRIHDAVKDGFIREPFTAKNVEAWMIAANIRKEDDSRYKEGYVSTLLSNSYVKKTNSTNMNTVWLYRRFNNSEHVYEYWFVD